VTRNGAVASDLSEGERNAIAFSFYLSSLDAGNVDHKSTLIVIDDPVTSLDQKGSVRGFRSCRVTDCRFCADDLSHARLRVLPTSDEPVRRCHDEVSETHRGRAPYGSRLRPCLDSGNVRVLCFRYGDSSKPPAASLSETSSTPQCGSRPLLQNWRGRHRRCGR